MEGTPITLVNGYPTAAFIDNTLVEFTGFGFTTPAPPVCSRNSRRRGPTIPNCLVTYTPAPAANGAPTIVATTTGCP